MNLRSQRKMKMPLSPRLVRPASGASRVYFQIRFFCMWLGLTLLVAKPAVGLPPPEDVPEEILRTEIITEARSPIDGKPLTAAEYAQLQAELAQNPVSPDVNPKIKRLIFLLRLRQMLRTIIPFY